MSTTDEEIIRRTVLDLTPRPRIGYGDDYEELRNEIWKRSKGGYMAREEAAYAEAEDDSDCYVTIEEIEAKLVTLEAHLADRMGLPEEGIRDELLKRAKLQPSEGGLVEDEIVSAWLEAYSCFVEWTEPDNG